MAHVRRIPGLVRSIRAQPARRDLAAVGLRAVLVNLLVQEVEAAGEPEGFDLFQEVLDGDGGVFGPASAQVLAVWIDEAGPVFRNAEHPLGPVCSGMAFDGTQGQLQATAAFEEAHALVERVVDLMPAFQRALRPRPVIQGCVEYGGPAVALRLHLVRGGCAQVVPHMPAVTDLNGVRKGGGWFPRRLSIRHATRPDPRMRTQPRFERAGRAVGQDVDPFMGFGVDHHGGTAVPPTQSEFVDADHSGNLFGRQ